LWALGERGEKVFLNQVNKLYLHCYSMTSMHHWNSKLALYSSSESELSGRSRRFGYGLQNVTGSDWLRELVFFVFGGFFRGRPAFFWILKFAVPCKLKWLKLYVKSYLLRIFRSEQSKLHHCFLAYQLLD